MRGTGRTTGYRADYTFGVDGAALREMRREYGLTQRQVACAAGIHQPDLSAIENGRAVPTATLVRIRDAIVSCIRPSAALRLHRDEVRETLERLGAANIRVFGSVLHGTDLPGSDLDLLAVLPQGTGLLRLLEMEDAVRAVVHVPVDIVPDSPRTAGALVGAKAEAVPL